MQQLFQEQVERTPQAVALACEEQQWTYRELNERANRLAHYLRGLGVGPEAVVAVCLERSCAMVQALLAILKAGAAYLPLDPDYPPQRLAFLLQDARVSVLLTQQHLLGRLPQHQARVLCLDSDDLLWAAASSVNPCSGVTPANLAYVIYTSGSTGNPKGVAVSHRGLINLVVWHQRTYAVTGADRASQLANVAFDASAWELWPYLAAGASVQIAPAQQLLSPSQLFDLVAPAPDQPDVPADSDSGSRLAAPLA